MIFLDPLFKLSKTVLCSQKSRSLYIFCLSIFALFWFCYFCVEEKLINYVLCHVFVLRKQIVCWENQTFIFGHKVSNRNRTQIKTKRFNKHLKLGSFQENTTIIQNLKARVTWINVKNWMLKTLSEWCLHIIVMTFWPDLISYLTEISQSKCYCHAFPFVHQIVLKGHPTSLKPVLEFPQDNILYCLCFYVQNGGFMCLFVSVYYQIKTFIMCDSSSGLSATYHFSCVLLIIHTSQWYWGGPRFSLEHPSSSKTACSWHFHPPKMVRKAFESKQGELVSIQR